MYSLYLYFLGLSLRNTSKALVIFKTKKEVMFLYGIGFKDLLVLSDLQKKRVSAFIIDETIIQIGNQHFWLWICIEPIHSLCLEYTYQKRETCLLLKNSLVLYIENMDYILYILMVEHGMMKHVMS